MFLLGVFVFCTGGYCFSLDQSSSYVSVFNNVCYQINSVPVNQHYGVGNTFTNNIFVSGYYKSWSTTNSGDLRTSPRKNFPNSMTLMLNINYLTNGTLFDGDWRSTQKHHYSFDKNVYYSPHQNLLKEKVFGGCSTRVCHKESYHYTFAEWQTTGMDVHGIVQNPLFEDNSHKNRNFRLKSEKVLALGFQQINLTNVGPL